MRLSKHFTSTELACKGQSCCSHSAPMSTRLIYGLEILREKAKAPLHINSGFRCITHNKEIEGAAEFSKHILGIAADVRTPLGYTDEEFYALALQINVFKGVGIYKGRIHVDVRDEDERVTWDSRS